MPKVNYNSAIANEQIEIAEENNARYNVYMKNASGKKLYVKFGESNDTIDTGNASTYDLTIEDTASIFLIPADPFEINKFILVESAGTGTVECSCGE